MHYNIIASKFDSTKSMNKKDMTHGVISIDSILLNSMRNGKNVNFRGRKMGITSRLHSSAVRAPAV